MDDSGGFAPASVAEKSAVLDSLSAVGIRGRSLDLSGIVSDRAFICRPGWTVHP